MVRLYRAACRKAQWNRMLNYSGMLPRSPPSVCCAVTCLLICLILIGYRSAIQSRVLDIDLKYPTQSSFGRHLLAPAPPVKINATVYYNYKCQVVNVSARAVVAWDTCDFEKSTSALAGWIVLYVFATVVTLIAMAIVCDDFFVPSLEVISEKLHLSDDVAGATFMAAGSSAPELFNSLAAVSFDSDAGIGTIAGSAVFNLLVIVAMSAAFAGKVLNLDWRPLVRDSFWYLVSIVFFIFAMTDSVVQIWDAIGMLILYGFYIGIMFFNARLMVGLEGAVKKCSCFCKPAEDEQVAPESLELSERHQEKKEFRHDRSNVVLRGLLDPKVKVRSYTKVDEVDNLSDNDGGRIPCCSFCTCCPDIRGSPPERQPLMGFGQWIVYGLKWLVFVLAFPFLCLFSWTIPECSREDLKKFFPLSFFISLLWIAAISFCMVTFVARLGCLLGVDTFVMALVFLAAGASIPDLLTSVIVAKDGFGDMAVSNVIGSNVFDIDLGLGLPFFIKLCINRMEPLDLFSHKERRYYCEKAMKIIPHVKFGIILIIVLAVCMMMFALSRFKLGKLIGVSFFLFYIGFLVYAFLQQFLCSYNC